ncbi:MAG: helix-turn-helix transcriptional regulator [Ignavibacteriales bacterium]|nr:helix-turn-helix transcriptional regulator [Ignavibacteriales bacterium]
MDNNNYAKFELIKNDIALSVYLARKSLGYNHFDLVKITGLTRPVISTIEKGSANPTIDSLLKLKAALKISDELLFFNEQKFIFYKSLLKPNYENYILNNSKLHIPQKYWKQLLKTSNEITKANYGKIVKICRNIVETNLTSTNEYLIQNATITAALGVIFQKDGFEDNLNFGFWFGSQFILYNN